MTKIADYNAKNPTADTNTDTETNILEHDFFSCRSFRFLFHDYDLCCAKFPILKLV